MQNTATLARIRFLSMEEEIRAAAPQREVGKRPLKGKRPRHQGQTSRSEGIPTMTRDNSPPVHWWVYAR